MNCRSVEKHEDYIGARILDMALYQSGLMVVKVKEIHMMYSKYNPTRAGKYINFPKWKSLKKACINIKNKDGKCFKYAIQCGYHKIYEKSHPENFYHYKNIENDLHLDGRNFQLIMILINLKNSVRMFQLICLKLMMRMSKQ